MTKTEQNLNFFGKFLFLYFKERE